MFLIKVHIGNFFKHFIEKNVIIFVFRVLVCVFEAQTKQDVNIIKIRVFQCILLIQFSHVSLYLSRSKRTKYARLSLPKELTSTCLRS